MEAVADELFAAADLLLPAAETGGEVLPALSELFDFLRDDALLLSPEEELSLEDLFVDDGSLMTATAGGEIDEALLT